MSRKLLILIAMTALTAQSFARRPAVPLLPPRDGASVPLVASNSKRAPVAKESLALGAELGTVGRSDGTRSDVFGLKLFLGGRVVVRVPVWQKISLKPSIGYFRSSETTGALSVTQNLIELGLGAHYALYSTKKIKLLAGVSQRFDAAFSTLSVYSVSQNTPAVLRYRIGPAVGTVLQIVDGTSLTADLEYTFGMTKPVRQFGSLTVGFLFEI
jgi:hypothetical protein